MANNRTLTSANSVLTLAVSPIFPAPIRIQGFSTDDVTDMDAVTPKETMMGIDGRLSAGFVPVPITQNITLQADSPSVDFFEDWFTFEQQARETYFALGQLVLPSVGKVYAMTRGVLTGYAPIPAARKTLQPRRFSIIWERVSPAPTI